MKILMVCLGNICRSPLAHGIMEHLVKEKGLGWEIDSAGTGNWHCGDQPDRRSIKVARLNGVVISAQRARQFATADFDYYDLILVMDKNNYRDVTSLANSDQQRNKVRLFLDDAEVPDPYWDDNQFAPVYQLIYTRCEKLLKELDS